MKLENRVIVITGAGGIICSEFAKVLAAERAKVIKLILAAYQSNGERVSIKK